MKHDPGNVGKEVDKRKRMTKKKEGIRERWVVFTLNTN